MLLQTTNAAGGKTGVQLTDRSATGSKLPPCMPTQVTHLLNASVDDEGFLSAFFTLVGTHGLHVSVGLAWILILAGQVMVKGLSMPVTSRLFRLGLFWHFLDIAWVGIFSIVYLPGLL